MDTLGEAKANPRIQEVLDSWQKINFTDYGSVQLPGRDKPIDSISLPAKNGWKSRTLNWVKTGII